MAKKNKSEEKLEEANFEVSSLDEVKDENGNGIFHMRMRTKIIAAISAVILVVSSILIYLTVENYLDAQMWQVIVWGLCGILSLYAIFARSIGALLVNVILFSVLSFFPFWQSGYEVFKPLMEKFSTSEEKSGVEETPATENKPAEKTETSPDTEKISEEKVKEIPKVENKSAEKVEETPAEKNSSDDEEIPEPPLPRI